MSDSIAQSKTPRTDAFGNMRPPKVGFFEWIHKVFDSHKQIELELDQAIAEIKQLKACQATIDSVYQGDWAKLQEQLRLAQEEIERLKSKNKLLESLADCVSPKDYTKTPVGCVFKKGWGGCDSDGYVELHPSPEHTVQLQVFQRSKTIHINGFWESNKQTAINAIHLKFK